MTSVNYQRRVLCLAQRAVAVIGIATAACWCNAETLNRPIVVEWGYSTIPGGLDDVAQVACGYYHNYALRVGGTVVGWGSNDYGQINTPGSLTGVTWVACGYFYTYALKSDGTLVGWGSNWSGETNTPSNLTGVTQVACGGSHNYALKSDGTLVGWGFSGNGRTNTPSNLTGVTQVACGNDHSYALKSDGTLVGWGYNWAGQTNTPSNLGTVKQVACGGSYTCALKSDGTVVGWGYNEYAQCEPPLGLSNVIHISCGDEHSYALKSDRTIVGWGRNDRLQLQTPEIMVDVVQISCGGRRSVALLESDCDADGIPDKALVAAGAVDDYNTNSIPDSCDLSRGWEEDCNSNNIIDSYEQSLNQPALADSGELARIGFGHPHQWAYASPSLSLNDPVLTLRAYGDFSAPGETLTVTLNGRFVGTFFATGTDKNDCGFSITRTITLPRAFYNECVAAPGGASDAIFDFTTSVAVNADQCPSGSWVRAQLSYTAAVAGDCNANSLLDTCEIALDPSLDGNTDGVIDACQGMGVVFLCPGDLDGGGSVDTADLSLMLMSFGTAMPGDPADLDGDQNINTADLSLLLLSFGPCG